MSSSTHKHPEDEALLAYLIPGQQDPSEHATIQRHLLQCDRCVAMIVVAQARLAVADEIATPLPAHLFERAEELARAIEPAKPAVERPVAPANLRPAGGWLETLRERFTAWSRLPVLVPASFAVGVLIMVFADQTLLRPGMTERARRSVDVEQTLRVTATTTPLRAEPNGNAAVLSTLGRGEVVAVIQQERDWYRARMSDGIEGWVDRRAFE